MAAIRYKYLIRDTDRHGNERWYVRVPGQGKVRIREVPGSEAFDSAYRRALEARPALQRSGRVQPHSLQALVNSYYASIEWRELSTATQKQRRSILNRICREHGERDSRSLTSKAVRAGRDVRRETPGAANNMLKTLKALYAWGIEQELVEHNPVEGIKRVAMNPAGFHTWTVDQCVSFEKAHPLGTDARMAYELALFAGLRRSDLIRIGRQHVTSDGFLRFTQQKTNREIQIFILPPLKRAMDSMPGDRLQFVQTSHGRPYTMPGIGNAMKRWTQHAGLPGECALHGLRKALGSRLAEAGLTEHQIAAVLGHAGTGAVKAYTRGADQKRLAAEALRTLGAQSVPLGETKI